MKRILVTGATGNIGSEVVYYLSEIKSEYGIIAAVRNVEKAKKRFPDYPSLLFRIFDFENSDSFNTAFKDVDTLFLLRPPHISQVEKFFLPLLESAKVNCIQNIVFLSVQGAEKSKVIPHNKIEKLIKELQFNFVIVRPSYFMQNLTTSLLNEIVTKRSITLPSGNAKFNWIDTKNIGEASARLILEFNQYQNKALEITGSENRSFKEVADLISEVTDLKISYKSINPIKFYLKKRKEDLEKGFAIVMTILHFLPRFQSEPKVSTNYKEITGKNPTTLREFIIRERGKLAPHSNDIL